MEDFKSLTNMQTHFNTHRNGSPTSEQSAGPISSPQADDVEECTCCPAKSSDRKVRFAHPTVTEVWEPEYPPVWKVSFAEPITNTALMSKEERAKGRQIGTLPGPVYAGNTGPIRGDVQLHYEKLCECFYDDEKYHAEFEDTEEGYCESFKSKYSGLLASDKEAASSVPTLRRRGSKASRTLGLHDVDEEEDWEDAMDRVTHEGRAW